MSNMCATDCYRRFGDESPLGDLQGSWALRGDFCLLSGRPTRGDQRWSAFLKNHAKAILACDFFVAVTATCRLLYVFVVIEHGSRRLARVDVTAHPSAAWTLQQLRELIGSDDTH